MSQEISDKRIHYKLVPMGFMGGFELDKKCKHDIYGKDTRYVGSFNCLQCPNLIDYHQGQEWIECKESEKALGK